MNFLLKRYEIQYWLGTADKFKRRGSKQKAPISISCPKNDSEKALFGKNSLTEVIEPSNLNNFDHQNQAIHIASHFIIDEANPLKSGLVCASKPQQRHNPICLYLILIISIVAFFLYSYIRN